MSGIPSLAAIAGSPHTATKARHGARAFAESRPIQFLARFGYVVRGVLYLVPGLLALPLALGRRGATLAPGEALEVIGHQPFGRALLMILLAGLVGYSAWGLTRALLDPWGRGSSPKGLGRRLGYGMSALAYGGFVLVTYHLLTGSPAHPDHTHAWATHALARPLGAWLLGAMGLGWMVGAGFSEVALGWTGAFEHDLRWERMGRNEHRWAVAMGRVGIVARGLIFVVIGFLLILSALRHDPSRAGGMGKALLEIARQPFGRFLLGVASAGLVVFGSFSILCARWMRTRSGGSRRGRGAPSPREVRHGII